MERITNFIKPDREIRLKEYLYSLSDQDRQHLQTVTEWLTHHVGKKTAIWAVGSSVREVQREGVVKNAHDLDLRIFTNDKNEKINLQIKNALENSPPDGFEVNIEPSHRDFSIAYNSRLWPEEGGRPINIIAPSRGDSDPNQERNFKKWILFHRGPFCELKKASSD